MGQSIQDWTKQNLWKATLKNLKFLKKIKFFKGCLPEILLGPILNTLSEMILEIHFGG